MKKTNLHTQSTSNKQQKLLNIYTITWICLASLLIISDSLLSQAPLASVSCHAITVLNLLFVLFFNKKGYYILACSIFILGGIVSFAVFAMAISPGIYAEFYLFAIPCIAVSLFKKLTIPIITLITCFLLFSYIIIFYNFYDTRYPGPAILILFLALFLNTNYFKQSNLKNEQLLENEKETIEVQAEELQKLNEFKTHFFVNLSHEIRTPITLIKGYASKVELPNHDKNNQNFKIINAQIKQIENILNNILDLSKLDAYKLTLEKKPTELVSFLNKHFADFEELFIKKNIDFNLNSNTSNIHINMDENLMAKSINNLLNNALKFTPQNGSVDISILLHDDLKIVISDNGIGIPNDELDKIFQRFYQSKNDITQSQGSGIGLSFTKSILNAHHFSIKATSIPHVKTDFIITIPKKHVCEPLHRITTPIITENNPVQNKNIENKKPTILVVDDHEQMRKYLKSILQNYTVIEAENGKEALQILEDVTVDLLLTDYMMPIMSGKELVKNVKKRKLKIPILIITASIDEVKKINMLRIGVDGYLNKPFIEEELLLYIENSLNAYKTIIDFGNTLSDDEKKEIESHADNFNENIALFINNNISDINFGVQDVAKHFEISRSTLNRKVKSILGQTTQQLITQARVKKAKELQVEAPFMSKKEIAKAVGVLNSAHFFKKLE